MANSTPFSTIIKTAALVYFLVEVVGALTKVGVLYGAGINSGLVLDGVARGTLFLGAVGVLYYYRTSLSAYWKTFQWSRRHTLVVLGVFGLFVLNNYFMAQYNGDPVANSQDLRATLGWTLLIITISSTYEELMYRGFIQAYIDQHTDSTPPVASLPFTTGNYWATGVFFVRHLGFFVVFDPLFAGTGLVLVLIFSFAAGWLLSTTRNLWVCVLFHILCNWIHIGIHAASNMP